MSTSLLDPQCPGWWNSTGDLQQVEDLIKKQVNNYICSHKETTSCLNKNIHNIAF